MKVVRMLEYSALFPEYAGRFVFIGDDGQGDFDAAADMLTLTVGQGRKYGGGSRSAAERAMPLLAFVAVHSVQDKHGVKVCEGVRSERIERLRARNPGVPVESSVIPGPAGVVRHRFFYFDDYMDLAEQLGTAGWLEPEQRDSVMQAFSIDHTPEPVQEVMRCNYLALRGALRARKPFLEQADEAEKESFVFAELALPTVARAHLRLAQVPQQFTRLVLEIVSLDIAAADVYWPNEDGAALPLCTFYDINRPRVQSSQSSQASQSRTKLTRVSSAGMQWEATPCGLLDLPWPCETLCHSGSRAVFDIGSMARCFVVLDTESDDALCNGQECKVSLLTQANEPSAERPIGCITIKVLWEDTMQDAMKVEDFLNT